MQGSVCLVLQQLPYAQLLPHQPHCAANVWQVASFVILTCPHPCPCPSRSAAGTLPRMHVSARAAVCMCAGCATISAEPSCRCFGPLCCSTDSSSAARAAGRACVLLLPFMCVCVSVLMCVPACLLPACRGAGPCVPYRAEAGRQRVPPDRRGHAGGVHLRPADLQDHTRGDSGGE